MNHFTCRHSKPITDALIFAYAQRHLASMFDELPEGVPEARVIEAAIEQLAARLAYERSREDAARYLGGTSRSLRRGDLIQM